MIKTYVSGGGTNIILLVTTNPNANVKLSNDKFSKTIIADENGIALFKSVPLGTYSVTSSFGNASISSEVIITNQINKNLPIGKFVKDMPIGTKIKFSNGKKFILMGKNIQGHNSNSATFVSEFIIEKSTFGSNTRYDTSILNNQLMPKYYNELNEVEKSVLLEHEFTTIPVEGNMTNYKLKSHFYIPSQNEVNLSGNVIEGVNLGFTDNVSRVKTLNGSANWWWLRTAYKASSDSNVRVVGTSGLLSSDYPGRSGGVVPACDLSGEAVIELDTDGYYVVKGI